MRYPFHVDSYDGLYTGKERGQIALIKYEDDRSVPFLTKQNNYIYVDRTDLKPISDRHYRRASLFTSTGFAVVVNENYEYSVIDAKGNTVIDFSDAEISLNSVNGLTFYKKEKEYDKKMPVWKWDWNIMGGGVKKEQTYRKIEIGILESGQILLKQDLPHLDAHVYLNLDSIDDKHIYWNGSLYEIKKNSLLKVGHNITEILQDGHFIKTFNGGFSVYGANRKKAIYSDLKGMETLSIRYGEEMITLAEVNKEPYAPEVPKLLVDGRSGYMYAFPQYDKVFPKALGKVTSEQIDFIKKTGLVYSINNSPYFLLGVFNYDHAVWAYDWLYIDTNGNVADRLERTYNFKVTDQVGNLVWPDRKMVFPDAVNTEKWKFGKITSYSGMEDLYIIPIEDQQEVRTKGLWNSRTQSWQIKPEYQDISVLDIDNGIYALQKDKEGTYRLYDNKAKQYIGSQGYHAINSDGFVTVNSVAGELIYYYIDIYTGKEYREE
ncbi:hypothetical protein [Sphingobacterium paucimobilis]|uniref:WG repeat-containing protein n=1 Tax=Sphingobacterium paucimobilis HER1398 TaxID=1346330 RepID=U2J516_9SPHI|nr:hypothetical protein [Sphingobacterium paucimobilis]ERJ60024.1 hypothetical protein M472_14765 [Sphingobacterium paucimobilis HER1398]